MIVYCQTNTCSEAHCAHISQAKKGHGLGRKHSPESERMRIARSLYWARKKGVKGLSPLFSYS
jgi:hypothetical protein